MKRAGFVAVLAALWSGTALAQVVTAITPDTAAGLATGTTVAAAGAVSEIAGGVRAGGSLFHSSRAFQLGAGDIARWTAADAAGVANVVNRVTGGAASVIAGTIDSTAIPNADFYFINPAGVIFTGTASVAVPNAAYFMAADSVRFADGARFAVATPGGSTFTVAAPQAFGFLGTEGSAAVESAELTATGTLVAGGRDARIDSSRVAAPELALLAFGAAAGELQLADLNAARPGAGALTFANSAIGTDGTTAILLSGGSAVVENSQLETSSTGSTASIGILLDVSRGLLLAGSTIASETRDGTGGNVALRAAAADIEASRITASTNGSGAAGAVGIEADRIAITGSRLESDANPGSTGAALKLTLTGSSIAITDSTLSSDSFGPGDAGAVVAEADQIVVRNSFVSSDSLATGSAGLLAFLAREAVTLDQSTITTDTLGERVWRAAPRAYGANPQYDHCVGHAGHRRRGRDHHRGGRGLNLQQRHFVRQPGGGERLVDPGRCN